MYHHVNCKDSFCRSESALTTQKVHIKHDEVEVGIESRVFQLMLPHPRVCCAAMNEKDGRFVVVDGGMFLRGQRGGDGVE